MKGLFSGIVIISLFFASCNKEKASMEELNRVMTQDSLKFYKKLYEEAAYFSIDKNENAQKVFAPQNLEPVMNKVIQDFTELNKQEGGNPLLPVDGAGEVPKLNKLSVINHKWLIVDFYTQSMVGEALIKYDYSPDKKTEFKVIDTVIY